MQSGIDVRCVTSTRAYMYPCSRLFGFMVGDLLQYQHTGTVRTQQAMREAMPMKPCGAA